MTDTTSLAPSSRELPLEAGGEVNILLTSSAVHLRGVDGDRVTVRTRDGGDIDEEIVMESSPGRVRIRDAERGLHVGPLRMRMHGGSDLEIEVPRTARLSLKTLSGHVEAVDVGAESRWASASGDMHLAVAGGQHTVDSMSGDIVVEATGAIGIRARSVSGDVRIRAPRIDALGASTTSGDIGIEADLGAGTRHQVSSVSGDVELVTGSPVRLETQTIAGDVRASGPHVADGGRGHRTIVVGDGSVEVAARTTSGDIRLRTTGVTAESRSSGPSVVAPVVPAAPEPPAAPMPLESAAPPAPGVGEASFVEPAVVVAEAQAAPNLRRPAVTPRGDETPQTAGPWQGGEGSIDRREAARLDILRALERGDLDIDAASHRLEQLEEAGPRHVRGWC